MSPEANLLALPPEQAGFAEVASLIAAARQQAFQAVNTELIDMRKFYETYRDEPIGAPLAHQLPWTHNLIILGQSKRPEEREFIPAGPSARKIYNSTVLLLHLMDGIAPQSGWRDRLRKLLTGGHLTPANMGFPSEWETHPIWNQKEKP